MFTIRCQQPATRHQSWTHQIDLQQCLKRQNCASFLKPTFSQMKGNKRTEITNCQVATYQGSGVCVGGGGRGWVGELLFRAE